MAGNKITQEILNNTLKKIIDLFKKYDINNWFIGYGTLLGIIRNKNCIDGDDDIDILCDKNDYDKIKSLLENEGFKLFYGYGINNSRNIIKTYDTEEYSSIDFYMCKIDENGNYGDLWEKVIWTNCYKESKLIEYNWNNRILYIPNNYETKLINRYGENWKIPQNNKGVMPRKRII